MSQPLANIEQAGRILLTQKDQYFLLWISQLKSSQIVMAFIKLNSHHTVMQQHFYYFHFNEETSVRPIQ